MRIAQVAPLTESVPPKRYGGTERVVHYLTEGLVQRGHDVTLFASGDSLTSADHVAVIPASLRTCAERRDPQILHQRQLMEVVRMADRFDVVHFHTDFSHFSVARYVPMRHLTTLHGPLAVPDMNVLLGEFPEMPLVSISNAQRKPFPHANYAATVYNGTPPADYTVRRQPDDYFAFLGRITPEKGPVTAIEIAKRAGVRLKMAAKVDPVDEQYFADEVEPLLSHPLIEYVGEVDERGKIELLSGARGLIFPIAWPEPFGLVMTESMACGTPVVAFRCGSVPEVMRDGVTGFVVDDVDQAVEAINKIEQIDRLACRQYFDAHFSVDRMVEGYLEVYRRIVEPSFMLPIPNRTGVAHAHSVGGMQSSPK